MKYAFSHSVNSLFNESIHIKLNVSTNYVISTFYYIYLKDQYFVASESLDIN
jgi:hypothetical protein